MGRPHSEDKLQDNGGLLYTVASTKTHVVFHHSLNIVIDKISKYLKQAGTKKEKKMLGEDDCRQITGLVILCTC